MVDLERDTIVLLKVLDSVKDLMALIESVIDEPSPVQRKILKRKLKIMGDRLPKLGGDIKPVVKRKETKQLNFNNLKEKTKISD